MLGRQLPTGSQAISFHNTLFRVSELCWVKVEHLTVPEQVLRALALLSAVAWVYVVGEAKQNYFNLECLLAVFPLVLAWTTSGSLRLGCSGDFEESYEQRRGIRRGLFTGWIEKLKSRDSQWVHLKGPNYNLLLNMHRLAWIRPCFQWKLFPLIMTAVFWMYHVLLGRNFDTEGLPFFDDFAILTFESGVGPVAAFTKFLIVLAVVAFGLSIKRSVELCGTGGVQDTFQLSAAHQAELLDLFAEQPANQPIIRTASSPVVGTAGTEGEPKIEPKAKKKAKAVPPTEHDKLVTKPADKPAPMPAAPSGSVPQPAPTESPAPTEPLAPTSPPSIEPESSGETSATKLPE